MVKALAGAYGAMVLALWVAAVLIWRERCEGFGCIGVTVLWFVWVVAFLVVLAVGQVARTNATPAVGIARASNVAWWLQVTLGALAVVVWAVSKIVA